MRLLITGITGFVGSHVAEFALARGVDVIGALRWRSSTGIDVQQDPARLRPSDVPILRGSAEKIQKATGWCTRIELEDTLTDLLEYWRQRIGSSAP